MKPQSAAERIVAESAEARAAATLIRRHHPELSAEMRNAVREFASSAHVKRFIESAEAMAAAAVIQRHYIEPRQLLESVKPFTSPIEDGRVTFR